MTPILDCCVSEVAKQISKTSYKHRQSPQDYFFDENEISINSELVEVWNECCQPNWDGHNAFPITSNTLWNANIFMKMLPAGLPSPSIGAEPDGHITLEWYRSPQRTLSISIGDDEILYFSALLGPSRACGTEEFFEKVPKTIINYIRRVHMA